MNLDPEVLKQLIDTFKTELEEQSISITNGLLALEKGNISEEDQIKTIESIFRSAHNIKGAARGLGIKDVGEIAHKIESLFNTLQTNKEAISSLIIDRCLNAVDKMQSALKSFITKNPLEFELETLLNELDINDTKESKSISQEKKIENIPTPDTIINNQDISPHETIRVSLEKIHKVSTLVEEIQVAKIAIDDDYSGIKQISVKLNQFNQLWKQILGIFKNPNSKEMHEHIERLCTTSNDCLMEIMTSINQFKKNMSTQTNELTILSNSLQEEVRMLRLIPASHYLLTLPRYVRDLAQELNKKIDLTITGEEVKLDKLVLEGLKDPINHILRNAIDHGIEDSEQRQKNGKSLTGKISIDIKDEGNQIIINITDDGSGIDVKKISEILINKNILTQTEVNNMNENEILDYIFRPGFSTKQIVTDVSGRGVGLDVVKANISELKGSTALTTKIGKGTTFCLRVPLTLSSERGLLVASCKQLFAIPTHVIERVIRLTPSNVINIEGGIAIEIEKHPIPLYQLAEILGFEQQVDMKIQDTLSILVIKKDWHTIALLVDEIIGEREIVIKPLQQPLTKMSFVAGGTLLERNQIVIVLNPTDLINTALHSTTIYNLTANNKSESIKEIPHILVVDDSITTRTLEKNILESKNYKVTVAVNGKEAWDILQKQKFSLLITDISMPIMDGFTLTEKIKQNENLRDLPVIIVTSLGSDAEKARGIEVGANAYIIKNNFESSSLLEIVNQLV